MMTELVEETPSTVYLVLSAPDPTGTGTHRPGTGDGSRGLERVDGLRDLREHVHVRLPSAIEPHRSRSDLEPGVVDLYPVNGRIGGLAESDGGSAETHLRAPHGTVYESASTEDEGDEAWSLRNEGA